jgi:hypothetical protein
MEKTIFLADRMAPLADDLFANWPGGGALSLMKRVEMGPFHAAVSIMRRPMAARAG